MAIINLDDIADNVRPYLKKDTYTARIIEAEFTTSKAGAPMIVLQWEVVAPEATEDLECNTVRIAGLQFRDYWSFSERAMEITLKKIKSFHRAFDLSASVDTDNPDVDQYTGLAADVTIETEQSAQTSDDGSPVLDDNGNAVMNNNYRLKRVLRKNADHTIG